MDASKKNLTAVKGSAPIRKVGQTSHKFYGTDPTPRSMVRQDDSTDLNLK